METGPRDTWVACVTAQQHYIWFSDMLTYEAAIQQNLNPLLTWAAGTLERKAVADREAQDRLGVPYSRNALDGLARGEMPSTPHSSKRKSSHSYDQPSKKRKMSVRPAVDKVKESEPSCSQHEKGALEKSSQLRGADILLATLVLVDAKTIQHLQTCIVRAFAQAVEEAKKAANLEFILTQTLTELESGLQDELEGTRRLTIQNSVQGFENAAYQLRCILGYIETLATELLGYLEVSNSVLAAGLLNFCQTNAPDHVIRNEYFWDVAKRGKLQHWTQAMYSTLQEIDKAKLAQEQAVEKPEEVADRPKEVVAIWNSHMYYDSDSS